jgi:hypothetical protein
VLLLFVPACASARLLLSSSAAPNAIVRLISPPGFRTFTYQLEARIPATVCPSSSRLRGAVSRQATLVPCSDD